MNNLLLTAMIILSTLSSAVGCNHNRGVTNFLGTLHDSIPVVKVEADITAYNETPKLRFPDIDSRYYFVTITLRNIQDTSVRFTIMTCSWNSSFLTDVDSIIIRPQECDKNFPATLEIKPGKSVKFFAELSCYKKNVKRDDLINFKIGFVDLLHKDLMFGSGPAKSELSKRRIYWSDPIPLSSKLNSYENGD